MNAKKLNKIKIQLSVQGEGTWQPLSVSEMTIEVDDTGSYKELVANVSNAMVAIRTQLDQIQRIGSDEIVSRWKEFSAAIEAQKTEAKKHEKGGEVWEAHNRANLAETENACLKKQVANLIEQLSKNIEQERQDGTL